MKAGIPRHLGVKGGAEQVALLDGDDASVGESGEGGDTLAGLFNHGRADEHSVHRRVAKPRNIKIRFEGIEL